MESWDGTPLRYMQAGRGGIRYDTIRYDGGRAGGRLGFSSSPCLPSLCLCACAAKGGRLSPPRSVSSHQEQSRAEERRRTRRCWAMRATRSAHATASASFCFRPAPTLSSLTGGGPVILVGPVVIDKNGFSVFFSFSGWPSKVMYYHVLTY
jgi:hypothetical protein